ncbi:hypothetical protein AVEN_83146-1 [Araneus ventricosus]|uniref:Uncharacterized protein n=1 Tax=Araneus ventricosus TaxID=182803 RepID=A0A4Y2AMG3_ARAVE|nr:hypothetical protein AVEN_83146-1 [Araneus ventricosus]
MVVGTSTSDADCCSGDVLHLIPDPYAGQGNLYSNPSQQMPSGTIAVVMTAPHSQRRRTWCHLLLIRYRSIPSGGTVSPSHEPNPRQTHIGLGSTSTTATTTKDIKLLTTHCRSSASPAFLFQQYTKYNNTKYIQISGTPTVTKF